MGFLDGLFGGGGEAPPLINPGQYLRRGLNQFQRAMPQYNQIMQQEQQALLNLQRQYGPQFAQALLELQRQYAPEFQALQQQLGRQGIENDISNLNAYSPRMREALAAADPLAASIHETLGNQILGDVQLGAGLDPSLRREIEQSIRAGQTARGNAGGNAAVTAEALGRGQFAENLRQNRRNAAMNYLQVRQQTMMNPASAIMGRTGNSNVQSGQPSPSFSIGNQLGSFLDFSNQANLMNHQLQYNASQAQQQGGGFGGMLSGALGGAQLGMMFGGPVGAGIGAIGGGLLGAG